MSKLAGFWGFGDSLLAVSLLLLNIFHEPLKDGLRLQTLLLNLSLLLLF